MRNVAMACGMLVVLGSTGLSAQSSSAPAGQPRRDSTGVPPISGKPVPRLQRFNPEATLNSGAPVGKRVHGPSSVSAPKLGIDQVPDSTLGNAGKGRKGRRFGPGRFRNRARPNVAGAQLGDGSVHFNKPRPNAAIDPGESVGPDIVRQKAGRPRGKIRPGNMRFRNGHPKGPAGAGGPGVGGAGPGKVNFNGFGVGQRTLDRTGGGRVKLNPNLIKGDTPTARRMARPQHRQRPDSL